MTHRQAARIVSLVAFAFAVFCVGFAGFGIARGDFTVIFVGVSCAITCGLNAWLLSQVSAS